VTDPRLDADEIHALVGEPSRIERAQPADGRLTVVSWNIAQGERYEQIRDVLSDLDADIYLLQEVDMHAGRSDYRAVAKDLADDLNLNWVFAGEFQEIGESRRNVPALTGQAILSRYPITGASVLRFRNQARLRWKLDPFQPRRGGRMALRAESGGVLVYNAHIESAKNDAFRHKQVDEMVFDHLKLGRMDAPVIFAGDFNTGMSPDESPLVRCLIETGFVDALGAIDGSRRTSVAHDDPLDWMFIRNIAPGRGRVIEVRKASDHYPLHAALTARPAIPALASAAIGPNVRLEWPALRVSD
jgi:endonuclease/exonuclease/phosphatase family metal-dependent hydrolase